MPSIWDMLFPGASQAPQFADPNGNPNPQLPVPFPGPQQAPYFGAQMNAQQPAPQEQTTPAAYDLRPIPQLTAPLWRSASDRYRASQFGDETRLPEYNQTGAYGYGGGIDYDPRQSPYPQTGPQLMPGVGPAVPLDDRRGEGYSLADSALRGFTGMNRAGWSDVFQHPGPAMDKFFGITADKRPSEAELMDLINRQRSPLAQEAGMRNLEARYPGYMQLPIPPQKAPVF
jgi:hypothetical protein